MKRFLLLCMVLSVGFACFGTNAFAWQGRMAGMADPYGLLEDESDFLVHPAMIADGEGVDFYGHFKYLYKDVSDWNYDFSLNPNSIRVLGNQLNIPGLSALSLGGGYKGSGDENHYDASAGAAFPLGCGRMGVFFNYKGKNGDYNGTGLFAGSATLANNPYGAGLVTGYNMDSSIDSFIGRIIYGLPLGASLKLGAELEVAYNKDKNSTKERITDLVFNGNSYKDYFDLTSKNSFVGTLFPFMYPVDSEYWEITPKIGLTGVSGPVKWGLTVRGGAVFSGDNSWSSSQFLDLYGIPLGVGNLTPPWDLAADHGFRMDGDVDGWKVGGDFWLRYALSPCMNLPFLLRVDHREINRNGSGAGLVSWNLWDSAAPQNTYTGSYPLGWDYEHKESVFEVETGAGLEYVPSKTTRIAGGLYYKYMDAKQSLGMTPTATFALGPPINTLAVSLPTAYDPAPDNTEHQIILRMAAEREINPCFVLRGGLKTFIGWVNEDFALGTNLSPTGLNLVTSRYSLSGTHWGIMGAIGATAKFTTFEIEPFIQAGYEEYDPDGDGYLSLVGGVADAAFDVTKERSEALIGAGISVRF